MDVTTPPRAGWPQPPPNAAAHPGMADLTGSWRRSLIAWADGTRDTTTTVTWLQGGTWYVDLRQPRARPDFTHVRRLRDLTGPQLAWLALQQGFAGPLTNDPANPPCFTWTRLIDFEPYTGQLDAGSLHFEDDIMVERGLDLPYLEHWHRDEAYPVDAAAAMSLLDRQTGQRGVLVRVGDVFGYARERAHRLAGPTSVPDAVAGADQRTAADLIDCEISLGTVTGSAWRIQRSSLPFREGASLGPTVVAPGDNGLRTEDVSPMGEAMARTWDVTDAEGDTRLITAPCAAADD